MSLLTSPNRALSIGLFVIFLIVLLGPFLFKKIEHHLEIFLFSMSVIAITLDHFLLNVSSISGCEILPNWNLALIKKALVDPIEITFAVLIAGLLFHYCRAKLEELIRSISRAIPLKLFAFIVVVVLGLLSSLITAIIAALLLVEIVSVLKLDRQTEVNLVIVSCFAIGLGAALTPVGEPLSTIVIRTKLQADFWYLFRNQGVYIISGVAALGACGAFIVGQSIGQNREAGNTLTAEDDDETLMDVGVRALKVYLFVIALVFLGIAFTPIIEWYINALTPSALYWVNITSAILDNATLASAEITKCMTPMQINASLMSLLISGGMLIPGNIPNIISASKLGITSKEWAKLGIPLGVAMMAVYFVVLFVLKI